VAYFYRARNAIYHLIRAFQLQVDDRVLVPDYHSGNEVWAIRAAGIKVEFYPIRRDFTVELDELRRLCKKYRPRALLVIHILGWPQPMNEIITLCEEEGIVLIEDCAHSLFSNYGDRPLGSLGDYSVFCLYKSLPVPNGGLLVQNRHVLEDFSKLKLNGMAIGSTGRRAIALLLEWVRGHADKVGLALQRMKPVADILLQVLQVKRTPIGDMGFDLGQADIPMSRLGRYMLPNFNSREIRSQRRMNYLQFRDGLPGTCQLMLEEIGDGICPLMFPLLTKDKNAAFKALRKHGVSAVEFWNTGDPEALGVNGSDAKYLRDHVLGLPLHQNLKQPHIDYIIQKVIKLDSLF
jgi:dTDP-4-amino-4,6-dideoxygalactose transaminase